MAVKTETKNAWGMPEDLPAVQSKPVRKVHIPLASQNRPIRKGNVITVPKDVKKMGELPKE